ncbi:MAG: DUF928 domain-containing protein [Cyanobacteria bacterium P01_A01_bin.84]
MNDKRLLFQQIKVKSAIYLGIVSLSSSHLPMQAQSILIPPKNKNQEISLKAPKFPDNGAPTGRRRGGTSRNDCPEIKTPLTALVPGKETQDEFNDSTSFLASTVSKYPTFWVYIPDVPKKARFGEFILQDKAGKDVYRTSINLTQTKTIIGISTPSHPKYSLEIGQKYHWYFKIYCKDGEAEAGYFYVDAWIQRVALTPDLKRQLQKVKSQKFFTNTDQNIWYDKLTILGKLVDANQQNSTIKVNWNKLLKSVGLQDVSQAPIEVP